LEEERKENNRGRYRRLRRWFRFFPPVVFVLIVLIALVAGLMPNFSRIKKESQEDYFEVGEGWGWDIKPDALSRSVYPERARMLLDTAATGAESRTESKLGYAFGTPASAQERTPKIIYTGSLTVKVAKLAESAEKILGFLPGFGGYLSQRNDSTTGTSQFIQMTVRLPSQNLEKFVGAVKALGEVLSYKLDSQEVTEEFMDLEARLKQLKLSEERLLEMMRKSGKLTELLQVERELTNKQSEIERIQGRLRYLEDRVAYSTLTVTLTTEAPPPQVKGFSWGFGETFNSAWLSLKITFRSFAKGLIWIAVYTPIWLGIGVIVWVLYLVGRRIFAV